MPVRDAFVAGGRWPVPADPRRSPRQVALRDALAKPRALLHRLQSRQLPGPRLLLGVAAGYLALTQIVLWLNDPVNLGAGFWPAAGLSLALLVRVQPGRWGWIRSLDRSRLRRCRRYGMKDHGVNDGADISGTPGFASARLMGRTAWADRKPMLPWPPITRGTRVGTDER